MRPFIRMQVLDQFFEISHKLVGLVGPDLHLFKLNKNWTKQLGWTEEELIAKPIFNFVTRESISKLAEMLESDYPHAISLELICKNGLIREYYFMIRKIPEDNISLLIGNDIVDFKEINYIMDEIQSVSQLGFWRYDLQSDQLFWSNEIFRIYNISPDTTINLDYAIGLIAPEYQRRFIHVTRDSQKQMIPFDFEIAIKTMDGEKKWVRIVGKPKIAEGKIIGTYGIFQDITSYRQKISAFDETQNRLQIALSANKMGIWDWNVENDYLNWDKSMYALFEVDEKDFRHQFADIEKLIHPDDRLVVREKLQKSIIKDTEFDTSFRIITKSGKIKHVAAKGKKNKYANKGTWVTGVNWDITQEKENEQMILSQRAQMISSSRLSLLGEMANGIAHEVNNPLGIILARANQLERKMVDGEADPKDILNGLKNIEDTCERIMNIVKGLRAFSRDADQDPKTLVDTNQVMNQIISLNLEKFKIHQVMLKVDLRSYDNVLANSVQLGQVFLNLLNNAFDATKEQEERWILILSRRIDHIVRVSIIDSGDIISDQVVDKIFDPFFSTKDVGQGIGLGLPISKGIIEEHGGRLWIDRGNNHTCFNIDLPIYLEDQLSI